MKPLSIAKFLFLEQSTVLDQALASKEIYQNINLKSDVEVWDYLSRFGGVLLICSLKNKEDFLKIANLCKVQKQVPIKNVKLVVINYSNDVFFEKALAKLGVLDCIEGNLPFKTLKYKIELWTKSLINLYGGERAASSSLPLWTNSIDCEDDIWLIKNESYCKKVLSRWVVRLIGPSPHAGQWVEVKNKNNTWHFSMKESLRTDFLSEDGEWFYQGDQKPEFVWKENLWLMTGADCKLIYQGAAGQKLRLLVIDQKLKIARNSKQAKGKLKAILKSFENDVLLQHKDFSSPELDISLDQLDPNNLKGTSSTDHLNNSQLYGDLTPADGGKSKLLSLVQSQNLPSPEMTIQLDENEESPILTSQTGKIKQGKLLDLENKNNQHETFYKGHYSQKQFEPSGKKHHLPNSKPSIKPKSVSLNNEEDEIGRGVDFTGIPQIGGSQTNEERLEKSHTTSGHKAQGRIQKNPLQLSEKGTSEEHEEKKNLGLLATDNPFKSSAIEESIYDSATMISKITYYGKTLIVFFEDSYDDIILFSSSVSEYLQESVVSVEVCFDYLNEKTLINFEGKIHEISLAEKNGCYLSIQIGQDNTKKLKKMVDLFSVRQKNVNSFLKMARGL